MKHNFHIEKEYKIKKENIKQNYFNLEMTELFMIYYLFINIWTLYKLYKKYNFKNILNYYTPNFKILINNQINSI